jgi:hypothetical protein
MLSLVGSDKSIFLHPREGYRSILHVASGSSLVTYQAASFLPQCRIIVLIINKTHMLDNQHNV